MGVPQILVVGGKDRSWGPSGRAYYARATEAGDREVELRVAPESGHFDMIAPTTSSWAVVMKALEDVFAAAATPGVSASAAAGPGMLVSADWVAAHVGDPGVVILHAETQRGRYDEGHMPGAHFLDMGGLMWEGDPPVGAEMRTPAAIDSAFEAAGVSDGERIVVYSANPLLAARAWMTLDVMGLGDRASMLDGGSAVAGGWAGPCPPDAGGGRPGH